jgi:hypothetical protein
MGNSCYGGLMCKKVLIYEGLRQRKRPSLASASLAGNRKRPVSGKREKGFEMKCKSLAADYLIRLSGF